VHVADLHGIGCDAFTFTHCNSTGSNKISSRDQRGTFNERFLPMTGSDESMYIRFIVAIFKAAY